MLLTVAYSTTILRKQFRQNTALELNLGREIMRVNGASLSDGSRAPMLPLLEKGSQGEVLTAPLSCPWSMFPEVQCLFVLRMLFCHHLPQSFSAEDTSFSSSPQA